MIAVKNILPLCITLVSALFMANYVFQGMSVKAAAQPTNVKLKDGVFTAEQVADPSRLLLSIAGHVFDVSAGEKFYGEKGPYKIFARKDASQIYGSGDLKTTDFRDKDNMDSLTLDGIGGVNGYLEWYKKKYVLLGVMHGRYFDHNGLPTKKFHEFEERVAEYKIKNPPKTEDL